MSFGAEQQPELDLFSQLFGDLPMKPEMPKPNFGKILKPKKKKDDEMDIFLQAFLGDIEQEEDPFQMLGMQGQGLNNELGVMR